MTKKIYLLGGGTVFHIRPHFALSAPAYGKTAVSLQKKFNKALATNNTFEVELGLTKMAGGAQPRLDLPDLDRKSVV